MPEYFPPLLFGSVSALCFALTLIEWNLRRRLALLLLAFGGFNLICFAANHAWARYSIRVDLLLTIPAVSFGAFVAGAMAAVRPSSPARALGSLLALGGAASLAWYSYTVSLSRIEAVRTMALFDEGTRLFWNETIHCQENFEKHFGPLMHRDDPCLGDLVVQSRSPNAYPFTRIVMNDRGEAQLLFSPQSKTERPVALRSGVFAQMLRAVSGEWAGEGDSGFGSTHVLLLPRAPRQCEARITRFGTTSILLMERKELSDCQIPTNPPVKYVGPWGEIATDPSGTRRLLQIWLWSESSEKGRGVLVNDAESSGVHREFLFLKHFRATRSDGDRWTLILEEPDISEATSLTMTISGQNARVVGPANFVGPSGEAILKKREFVTDARIELVPVRDQALFRRYLDSALFNLDLSWTAS